jgi:hypothetical protein
MRLLRAGVPLSLLLDLADPQGPDTRAIMEAERCDAREAEQARFRTLAAALSTPAGAVRGPVAEPA